MKRFLIIVFLVFVIATPGHAKFFARFFTSLTGDVSGSVDHLACSGIHTAAYLAGGGLTTDDGIGYVQTSTGETYFYVFDQSATNATSAPDYIRCKTYTASGV